MAGCQPRGKSDAREDSIFAQRTTTASVADANSLDIISSDSYQGISPGDKLAAHEDELVKSQLVNGEGNFTVYLILNEQGGKIGYLMPDPNDATMVGDITITSSTPVTTDGMRVGMTLGDLFNRYRNLEIHGSEIESRTTASKDQLSFRLDAEKHTYQVDPREIPLNTKITEISINRPSVK